MIDLSYENKFGGLARIYGDGALTSFRRAHVIVVGLGGVGSWAAEALARTGIGTLSLVDLDDVCATNTNRQLHALEPNWGRPKAEALGERLRQIHPENSVNVILDFFTEKSAERLLSGSPTVVVDAIDSVADKVTLVAECRRRGIPLVMSGGAGGKTDPTKVRCADLSQEHGDALLKSVKRGLKSRGIAPDSLGLWGVDCVFSEEKPVLPWEVCSTVASPQAGGSQRIDCASGFGAVTFGTGTFGFVLASRVVHLILNRT